MADCGNVELDGDAGVVERLRTRAGAAACRWRICAVGASCQPAGGVPAIQFTRDAESVVRSSASRGPTVTCCRAASMSTT